MDARSDRFHAHCTCQCNDCANQLHIAEFAAHNGFEEVRADPQGILVLREYSARQLRSDDGGPTLPQVIFAIDLTTADGLFAARKFEINPGDTVLATESPVTAARTILGLFGSVLGLSLQVNNATN